MTTHQREQIRFSLLRYCDSSGHFGLTAMLLHQFLRAEGFRTLTVGQLQAELQYLHDKQLLTTVAKLISPENPSWRVTAAGRDHLASQNPEE